MMELVDMNSLGLFDFLILSVQVGFTLSITYLLEKNYYVLDVYYAFMILHIYICCGLIGKS